MCIPSTVTTNDWHLSNSGCPTDDNGDDDDKKLKGINQSTHSR